MQPITMMREFDDIGFKLGTGTYGSFSGQATWQRGLGLVELKLEPMHKGEPYLVMSYDDLFIDYDDEGKDGGKIGLFVALRRSLNERFRDDIDILEDRVGILDIAERQALRERV